MYIYNYYICCNGFLIQLTVCLKFNRNCSNEYNIHSERRQISLNYFDNTFSLNTFRLHTN